MMRFIKVLLFTSLVAAFSITAQAQQSKGRGGSRPTTEPVRASEPVRVTAPEVQGEDPRRSSNFRWDAFVDLQGRVPSKNVWKNSSAATINDRGFTVNDAALIMSKDFNRARALVDLPFYTSNSGTGSNAFNFAQERAQAYVLLDRGSGLQFKVGQFESFFGIEANHSRDRYFSEMGAVKANILSPAWTHTGVQVGYAVQNISLRGQFVNANSAGSMAVGQNPEVGFHGRFDAGPGYAGIGFSFNETPAPSGGQTQNLIFDITGGLTAGKFRADGEIVIKKTSGVDKTANGFAFIGTMPFDDTLAIGGRFEYLKDAVIAGGTTVAENIMGFSVGPSYQLQQDLLLRGDFSFQSLKIPAGIDDSVFGLTGSLVADF